MASFEKTSTGRWRARVSLGNGRQATKTHRLLSEARSWATDVEARRTRAGWGDYREGRTSVAELVSIYIEGRGQGVAGSKKIQASTEREYRGLLARHIESHRIGGIRVGDVTPDDVQAWVMDLTRAGVGATTVRHAYTLLSSAFKRAAARRQVAMSPCIEIDLPVARASVTPGHFTAEETWRILVELDASDRGLFAVMCWSGLRYGEAAALRPEDVDVERCTVMVQRRLYRGAVEARTKGGTSSLVAVPPWVATTLAGLAADGREWLFRRPHADGPPKHGAFWLRWGAALRRAEVPYRHPHATRHTAASLAIEAGIPLYDVKTLLRHGSVKTTEIYAHPDPSTQLRLRQMWGEDAPRVLSMTVESEETA